MTLRRSALFIARDAPQIGAVFADRTFHAADRLSDFPCSGRIVPELDIEIILGNYRLIYRIREDPVQVITIHHGARLLDVGKIIGGA